jgi:uncharacterized repeat protein (TIGR01451 family)
MALGDLVMVRGTLKLYHDTLLEIDPMAVATWVGTGAVPTPVAVTTPTNLAPTQGQLVETTGTFVSASPSGSNTNLRLNTGAAEIQVYIYSTTKISLAGYAAGDLMKIIGISGSNYNTPQINPRSQSDIIDLRPPQVSSTTPTNGATGVSLYRPLTAVFNKNMDGSTFTDSSFTLTGPSGAVAGVVSYDAGTRTATFTPAAALDPTASYTAKITTAVKDAYGIALGADYIWSFTTGATDTTAPAITGQYPAANAVNVPLTASVYVTFTEEIAAASRDAAHFSLTGPYGAVPASLIYNPAANAMRVKPETSLLPTTLYTMTVKGSTADIAGLTLGSDVKWNFTTSVEPPMSVFFGDIHNHTSYSDGSGTPTQALAAGKAAGFDFMAITDHSYAIDDTEWNNTLAQVNAATTSDFVAIRGFEYTQGAEGHINVYNTINHATRSNMVGCSYCFYTPNLEAGVTVQGFYKWVLTGTQTVDDAGTVMQFNHPGWINFNDWAYHPELSNIARLEEVGNGSGTSYVFSEDEFIRSLDYGWKLGATNNADTHSVYWGLNTDHRTGVLAPELTKTALLEALRQRRTFASEDKNASIQMKANGAWMGSEIANAGHITFSITGADPDNEIPTKVELITDQGKVIETFTPTSASYTQTIEKDITTGVHYFYIKVTQADGDRIVTSPVWTLGTEDISITDVVIQPTIPTIHSPSLLTARVTNRNANSRTVTVSMTANGSSLGSPVTVVVPGNSDGYANFSWQPTVTGLATIVAEISGAPAGDNPDDNTGQLMLDVTDDHLPLILIDAGHGNLNAAGREMRAFIDDLSAHHYNVLKNLDGLTAADLNPDVVKLLIITAPQTAYTSDEMNAIGDFVNLGGSVWMLGMADYTSKQAWADTVADRLNAVLDRIETRTGEQINMRMNDDEVIDGNTNNGYPFGVIFKSFPGSAATSIGVNVAEVSTWSLNSLRGRGMEPLTASTPNVTIVMQGDLDLGCTADSWKNPYRGSNTDADAAGDAYIYNPTWACTATEVPAGALPLPVAAVTDLSGAKGRIMLYGDSNDPFTTFAYTAGDGKQNELFNLQSVMWLLGQPLAKSTIAQARAQAVLNQPDNLNKLVWIEGTITAAFGEFFNVLYVQDDTGGITIHAPAGDIDAAEYARGKKVRVVGTVDIYNGDTEIQFFEAEMVQVLPETPAVLPPMPLNTHDAALETNQGWLGVITGTVTAKNGLDNLTVNDGSGPVRAFLDGYNGDFSDISVGDRVRVTGMLSEDELGNRIRVRNYKMHSPAVADDVVKLPSDLSVNVKVSKAANVDFGASLTYTITLMNNGTGTASGIVLTDTLPAAVTFGSFVQANGATQSDGVVKWLGSLNAGASVQIVFTVTTSAFPAYTGQNVANSVAFTTSNSGSGSDDESFTFVAPNVTLLPIIKK